MSYPYIRKYLYSVKLFALRPILHRLGQMVGGNIILPEKVGYGPRDFHNSVEGTAGKIILLHGLL